MPKGAHEASWDGKDRDGHPVAAGIYWLRVSLDGQAEAKRMVLLK